MAKFRQTACVAGIVGMYPGDWREFEADEDAPIVEAAIHNQQLNVQRWDGAAWVEASWRFLSGIEQARRLERQRLIGQIQVRVRRKSDRLGNARAAVTAAQGKLDAAAAEAKLTLAALAAAEAEGKTLEAEIAGLQAEIAKLEKTPVMA